MFKGGKIQNAAHKKTENLLRVYPYSFIGNYTLICTVTEPRLILLFNWFLTVVNSLVTLVITRLIIKLYYNYAKQLKTIQTVHRGLKFC